MRPIQGNYGMFVKTFAKWLICLLMSTCLALSAVSAFAEDKDSADIDQRINQWQQVIDQAQAALKDDFLYVSSKDVVNQLDDVRQQAKDAISERRKKLESSKDQLQQLTQNEKENDKAQDEDHKEDEKAPHGSSNKNVMDDLPEDGELATLKAGIEKNISRISGQITRIEFVATQAKDTVDDISGWEQRWLRDLILQRNPLPTSLAIWSSALHDAEVLGKRIAHSPIVWWQNQEDHKTWRLHLLWLLPLLGILINWPIRRLLLRYFGRDPEELEPTYTRRIFKCFIDGLANSIVPVAIILFEVVLLKWLGLLNELFGTLMYIAGIIGSSYMIIFGMARAAISPNLIQWRILPVEPAHAKQLMYAIGTVFGIVAIAVILLSMAWESDLLTPPLESVFFLFQSILTAIGFIWLFTPRYWASSIRESQKLGTAEEQAETLEEETVDEEDEHRQEHEHMPRWLRVMSALRWLIWLTPLMTLLGYGRLSFHIQSRLLLTIGIVGVALLLRLALHEALGHVLAGRKRRRGKHDRQKSEDTEMDVRATTYWAGLIADIFILIPMIYLLFWLYGVPVITLRLWTHTLLEGVKIGNVTLSVTQILTALLVLIIGLFATNLTRRWMTRRLLPNTRLDSGARDSIAAGTGYLGVFLAILLAIASLGISFSSLAIVAGALSVGIGFGLQNVVQNFVAGLLLLVERPFKVGDWVQVGDTEGIVKHISVRATEVETFQRSSVFVPNSDLISNQVLNWTHTNRIARTHIKVHVAYGNDPREIEKILLQCAQDHPNVPWYPASYVWFRGFADGVLNFELRAYMNDTDNWVGVDSQLYMMVYEALRDHGIEIPVPQREVFMRPRDDDKTRFRDDFLSARKMQSAPQNGQSSNDEEE